MAKMPEGIAMLQAIERLQNSLASALELVEIRDRKIALQAKEIAFLKKLLALKYQPKDVDPRDREPDKYPGAEKDRAELETEGYPHYDELMERKDA